MVATLQGPFGPVVLNMPMLTIGYAPDNQLAINDPNASPYHAVIRMETQHASIMDLGSVNGTYVNEQRLEPNRPRLLSNNDTIRVGNTVFGYVETSMAPSVPLFPPMSNRESNAGITPEPQAGGPGVYTAYGQQQGNQYPQYPAYTPPPPPYNPNPYDSSMAPTQVAGANPPFPAPTNQLSHEGLGQPFTPPPSQQKKSNQLKIVLIAAAAFIVLLAAGGGIFAYVATRPQPVITVNSQYAVDMTPAGSASTDFRVKGSKFSGNSSITFLLDGEPAPGAPAAQSDSDGKITSTLAVAKDWPLGSHVLTAKDGSGYTTKDGVTLKIVSQGQAHTPGPNGAPPDDTSFAIDATYTISQSHQIELDVSGRPDPTGGSVCTPGADGSQHTDTGVDNIGTYMDVYSFTCTGTYKAGQLTFTETLSNDKYTYTNGVTCTEHAPFVYLHFEGTFSSASSISGSFSRDNGNYDCTQGASITYYASHSNWTGQKK